MHFTYEAYGKLLNLLQKYGYEIANYHNWNEKGKPVILRHDIDNDLNKALRFAELEKNGGVSSTYFVMVTSSLYNAFSKQGREALLEIKSLGHEVGVHYDERVYSDAIGETEKIRRNIQKEAALLGQVLDSPVTVVSMHRPSKIILESDLKISGIINSYGKVFFHDFKYVSDSRRRWRESVEEIIESRKYQRLHILTHAFWYNDIESNLHDSISNYINSGSMDRYKVYQDNFTDLSEIMSKEEVKR